MAKRQSESAPRSYNPSGLSVPDIMALKKKADAHTKIQVRVGGKKLEVPVTAQMLRSNENGRYVFLSIPSMNVVMGANGDGTYEIVHESEKLEAVKVLKKAGSEGRKTTRGKSDSPELSPDILSAIAKSIPAGYRLGVDQKTGDVKLVKTRAPRKSKK